MSKDKFIRGIGEVEDRIIERYDEVDKKLSHQGKKKNLWIKYLSAAACICLIVSGLLSAPQLIRKMSIPKAPIYENAIYSAEDIGNMFNVNYLGNGTGTTSYHKVYVPSADYLNLYAIPNDEYINIYNYNYTGDSLDKNEFNEFLDGIFPKLAVSLNTTTPEYTIKEQDSYSSKTLGVSIDFGNQMVNGSQSDISNYISISTSYSYDPIQRLSVDGEYIKVDQTQSDEDITKSLSDIKTKLFDIFGVSFNDAKVVRTYVSDSEYGSLYVYFYNEDAHSLNFLTNSLVSNYISIRFNNYASSSGGDVVNKNILESVFVTYNQFRSDVNEIYQQSVKAKRISIEDAEKLLLNGYVFGGHSCPICMAAQDSVDFSNYDFVSMEYMFGYPSKNQTQIFPFYAFYKYISKSENGNETYAKTYVPAIEVKGYEEYFKSQKSYHK